MNKLTVRKKISNDIDGKLIYISYAEDEEPYDDNDITTHNIFRKYVRKGQPGDTELTIVKKLLENPNENIIKIFSVNEEERWYETELIDTYTNIKQRKDVEKETILFNKLAELNNARLHLHKLGIAYIDWKIDNTGLSSEEGSMKIKLFDFDSCGLFYSKLNTWTIKPYEYVINYLYAKEIFNTYICTNSGPPEIDNFLFQNMLFNTIRMYKMPKEQKKIETRRRETVLL